MMKSKDKRLYIEKMYNCVKTDQKISSVRINKIKVATNNLYNQYQYPWFSSI